MVCDWIWEKPAFMHTYLEIPSLIKWTNASQEGKQLLVCNLLQLYSYSYSIHQLLNGWLPELPAILDSFLLVSQYLKHSYRGGGWGWWGATVTGKGYVNIKNNQMASIGAIFTSAYHTKQLNPWTNTSAGYVVNYSLLPACQGEMEPFEDC